MVKLTSKVSLSTSDCIILGTLLYPVASFYDTKIDQGIWYFMSTLSLHSKSPHQPFTLNAVVLSPYYPLEYLWSLYPLLMPRPHFQELIQGGSGLSNFFKSPGWFWCTDGTESHWLDNFGSRWRSLPREPLFQKRLSNSDILSCFLYLLADILPLKTFIKSLVLFFSSYRKDWINIGFLSVFWIMSWISNILQSWLMSFV